MSTITKHDLINRIAQKTHLKVTTVKRVVQQLLDEITAELVKGNRLEFRNFGVFEPWTRDARTAVNPRTMENIHVPAKRAVRFKIGQKMKGSLDATIRQDTSHPDRSELLGS